MPSFIGFIPTQPEYVNGFFELVKLLPSDTVYDLGSGDGRLLFAALENGAGKAVGVELNPEHVRTARDNAVKKGFQDRASFIESDVLTADLSGASVVFCYLCTAASAALKPRFESGLKAGTRVVMESFPVPGWKPFKTFSMGYKTFYLYIMPPVLEP